MPTPPLDVVAADPPRDPSDGTRPAPADSSLPRYQVGDRLPIVCELKHISAILGVTAQRTFQLYEDGEFDFAMLNPTVGNKPRFSGLKLQAWVEKGLPDAVAPQRRTGYLQGRR